MSAHHEEDRFQRRARVAPGVAVGVDEAMIKDVVHTFYERVREDELLGPIFNSRVGDWGEHLAKLCDFWSSVLLMTGRFKGSPMQAHAAISEIDQAHFARWLALWRQTVQELAPAPAAELFIAKAEMIAESLQLGIASSRGLLPVRR